MSSLDETVSALWVIDRPPLGLLGATLCARALALRLEPEERAPFDALSAALLGWWPAKKRAPAQIYEVELAACVAAHAAAPERLAAAMNAANVEMAALNRLAPRSMPRDRFASMDEEDFVALVHQSAKHERIDLATYRGRLEHLANAKVAKWPELVAMAERIAIGRTKPGLRALPDRTRDLARLADLGATWSWSKMGDKHALRLELGDTKRMAVITEEERSALVLVVPWLDDASA